MYFKEAWMSGLNQRFTKPSFLNRNREFESHRLREQEIARGAYFLSLSLKFKNEPLEPSKVCLT